MIDFHCHLDLFPEPDAILRELQRRDMSLVSVTTTPLAWEGSVRLAARAPRIVTSLGLHPELAHSSYADLDRFESVLPQSRVVGEVGLDGSPALRLHRQAQLRVFRSVLTMCSKEGGRLLSIHSRGATTAVLDCLHEVPESGLALLHWFSGSRAELDRANRMGCWFSVGPAMLAGAKGRMLLGEMPRDRVVCETDAPFATVDGAALLPWDIARVGSLLAETWECSVSAARHQIEANEEDLLRRVGGALTGGATSPTRLG
ncbi:MAG: TatD family hydrolase [Thermoflexaceae bacterium]|nr:TatD family hydrolase [Thermoflexaceae bacterium]